MTEDRKKREIVVTIHGLKAVGPDARLISANLFKAKFQSLLSALAEADKTVNEKRAFSYLVSHLAIGSAEFGILEQARPNQFPGGSPVHALMDCADSIYRSSFNTARQYNGIAHKLAAFSKGAELEFDRIDIGERDKQPIPIDAFFVSQIEKFTAESAKPDKEPKFFRGQSHEAFDGVLGEMDFRGRMKRGILVLSGTTMEISCVFPTYDSETITKFGDRRVWATGNAIYDGSSELPSRLEIFKLEPISLGVPPSQWKGSLSNFERGDWGPSFESIN
jgi:hypothetical protein